MKMGIFKSSGERRVEAATWGLLLIWAGAVIVADNGDRPFVKGVPAVVAGGILLLSAAVQKVMGWEAGFIFWAGGIAFGLSGLNDLTHGKRNLPVLAVILIIAGVLVLLRALSVPGGPGRHLRGVSSPHDRPGGDGGFQRRGGDERRSSDQSP